MDYQAVTERAIEGVFSLPHDSVYQLLILVLFVVVCVGFSGCMLYLLLRQQKRHETILDRVLQEQTEDKRSTAEAIKGLIQVVDLLDRKLSDTRSTRRRTTA